MMVGGNHGRSMEINGAGTIGYGRTQTLDHGLYKPKNCQFLSFLTSPARMMLRGGGTGQVEDDVAVA
ncbi:hypothetical protein A2U01_0054126, partial [Trifolium medium]|nr:hypothetical protein [Trifolium medium]